MEYKTLSNGLQMPMLGFGVYQVSNEETKEVVKKAIECGYRLFDTAQSYGNEEGVGQAIVESGIAREEFFITTKIWISNYGYEKCKASLETSLKKLKTDYIDLVLLHQPFNDYYGAYRALEDAYKEGKVKAIGVSNFMPDRLVDLCQFVEIKPMMNQIETNVFQQQKLNHVYMNKYGVAHEAWAPFGEGKNGMFTNETLVNIGKKYNKSAAQVALRYLLQSDVIVIPKSVHTERMLQNINVFDFTLSEEDKKQIEELDTNTSLFFSHYDPAVVEMITGLVR